ncbi:MAG: site-specific integrase [Actinobacteria bacterium]|nr:site-specific integrase [Actinomycetota bacterium]
MPSGAAVIRYEGKTRTTWRVKYRDADGRQVKETLGPEPRWNETRAQRELGKRLDEVEKGRWRKPAPLTFARFAERFEREYLPGRNLKTSTVVDYELTLRRHLVPAFGDCELRALEPADIDGYITSKTGVLSPKTIRNHLGLLGVMFKVALRWRLVDVDPTAGVESPKSEQPEMQVLTEAEVARLLVAYRELGGESPEDAWWNLTRRLVTVALGTALRRGELLALRWQDVELLEGRLTVRRSYVRGEFTTPKSRTSRRTIELGPKVQAALGEQWESSRYRDDDDLVFGHPALGSPLDASKLSRDYMRPALTRAKIEKPFRSWHDLRHTALTHEAAAGNPQAYVQHKAGHSQGSITERYIHAAQVLFPGAAEKGEARLFSEVGQ